jgi:hypothetical protein
MFYVKSIFYYYELFCCNFKKFAFILFIILSSCNKFTRKEIHIDSEYYELIVPKNHKELLILFPMFGGTNETIKTESNIVEKALKENISILIFKINQNLFLDINQQKEFGKIIFNVINKNNINGNKIFLGGFSAGGNLALQIGKYLTIAYNGEFSPKGILVVDAPVDLEQFYNNNLKVFKETNSANAEYFLNLVKNNIGNPKKDIDNYKMYSPYLGSLEYIDNVSFKNTELIFYTELALKFRKENFNQSYEATNGFQLKKLAKLLNKNGTKAKVNYIETHNKGYRKNGIRNPHSWSIINEKKIIDWIKN